ncbi:taurine ABC transporter, periplasmic binding protein [Collimonas arenae]|uniref:Taurine ABC transporter, periplasmic binding protein n=1 Tax=Collimonas arenae TaxID=279058 RepID=A0A127PR88_9BURK|nr:taurine ABC transporter substrate-binding protein [Collimonas arenae]AMP00318.1 taurine ABC transporter, periplasmic binding protein [Collimonas arenae]AMP10196.1 taurine ABC transporter, periplasmic binding protein [Collimonas arenae]
MIANIFRRLPAVAAVSLVALLSGHASAADKEVNIAYQTVVEPAKVAQADGDYEKASGWKINWKKFDSGADVITAVASGDIQIGYVGSSPLAAAATRELPIETILIAAQIGQAEALVVRNGSGIKSAQDLVGKKIAVPFVSTTHYSLLAALKHWGIDPAKVQILNLRPPEIIAAWQRGDIDAAYVWDPALGKVKESGKVLTNSAEVAKWGAPTFDAWIVRKDFAQKNPDFVTAFVKVTGKAYADYRVHGSDWKAGSPQFEKIARLTAAKQSDIAELLAGSGFPTLPEQAQLLGNGTVKALAATSGFLQEQKKVERVLTDYQPYVNPAFAKAAIQ